MKKGIWILVWVVGVISLALITYAQGEPNSDIDKEAAQAPAPKVISMNMFKGKQPVMSNPRDMMLRMKKMATYMVATADGGVAILDGDKLFKYDKDLNLVKEIKVDRSGGIDEEKSAQQDMPACPRPMKK